jgi:long-chain acyl-CoA synthetase
MINENEKKILVTGASGFLAGELLPRLLEKYPQASIYILLRAENKNQLLEKKQSILNFVGVNQEDANRVIALAGDVEKQDLGLGDDYDELAGQINEIYHSAANTRFDQPLEKARQINYFGSENVLRFAEKAQKSGNFTCYHHISTAYVAGNRTGLVREDELDCGQGFYNTYEQSKYESELMLRKAMDKLPIIIYRPSIVAGDSLTGRTPHFYVIYEPMKWVYLGHLTFLPCRPEVKLDIVPIDYVCNAIMTIGNNTSSIGKTFHLTAGTEKSISLEEMVDGCLEQFNKYNSEVNKPLINRPEIVTPEIIKKMQGDNRRQSEIFFQRAWQQMQRHMPYVVADKTFDDTATRKALEQTDIQCPAFRDYLPTVVRYALKQNFRAI